MTPSGSLTWQTATVENGKVILKMQSNSELDFRSAKAHTGTHAHTRSGWVGWMVLGFKPVVYVTAYGAGSSTGQSCPQPLTGGLEGGTLIPTIFPAPKTSTLIIRVTSKTRQTHFYSSQANKEKEVWLEAGVL